MDYNSTWWLEFSDKYVDEYEAIVNETKRKEASNLNKSTSKDRSNSYPYKNLPRNKDIHSDHTRRNVSYQRWDEERNKTTKTYVMEPTGITKKYQTSRKQGDFFN